MHHPEVPISAPSLDGSIKGPLIPINLMNSTASPQRSLVSVSTPALDNAIKGYNLERDSLKRAIIYAHSIRPQLDNGAEIKAANSLGTTATDLVAQRTLDLLVEQFPEVIMLASDYSDAPVPFGQEVSVLLVTPPTAGTYHTTDGYVSQPAVSTSKAVAVDRHKFVQHEFHAQELSGSIRDLFKAHSPGMAYALGFELVTYLYSLVTAANYPNENVRTQANFDRTGVIEVGTKMNLRKVARTERGMVLNPTYAGQLFEDPAIVTLGSQQQAGILTQGRLPNVHGFEIAEGHSLPEGGNLVGFGFHRAAMAIAVRIPNAYVNALQGVTGGGVSSVITEPNTKLSVQKVDFIDHRLGRAYSRLAWMYGAAVARPESLQRIVSAPTS